MPAEFLSLDALLPLTIGLLLLLFGWVLYRLLIGVAGGILGGAIGVGIGWLVAQPLDLTVNATLAVEIVLGIIGAVAGVAAFRFASALAFFLIGTVLGGWGYAAFFPVVAQRIEVPADPDLIYALGIPVFGLLGGLVVVTFRKHVIALLSAAVGTLLIMDALEWPYNGLPALVLFPAGFLVQTWFSPGDDEDSEED